MKDKKIVTDVLYMLIGAVLCVMKEGILGIGLTVIGVCAIVMGIVDFCKKDIVGGVIKTVIGVFVIYAGWLLVNVILYVIAAILIIQGIIRILSVLANLKRLNKVVAVFFFIESVATLAIGICLVFYKGQTLSWIFIVAGILLIIEGILTLCAGGKKRRR